MDICIQIYIIRLIYQYNLMIEKVQEKGRQKQTVKKNLSKFGQFNYQGDYCMFRTGYLLCVLRL